MPNHIMNHISVRGDDSEHTKLREIMEFLRPEGKPLGYVDFNKLIPIPPSLNIEAGSRGDRGLKLYKEYMAEKSMLLCNQAYLILPKEEQKQKSAALTEKYKRMAKDDPEVFELGRQYYENIRQYGCTTWYDWCIKNWGTKWNAYECVAWDKSMDQLSFYTAWSGVPTILEALSKRFSGMEIEYRWADEDIGNNVGWMVYEAGTVVEDLSPGDDTKEAYEQAAEMWEFDLVDEGFRLSKDGSTYEYADNSEPLPSPEPSPKKKNKNRGVER